MTGDQLVINLGDVGQGLIWGWLLARRCAELSAHYSKWVLALLALGLIGAVLLWLSQSGWSSLILFAVGIFVGAVAHLDFRRWLEERAER